MYFLLQVGDEIEEVYVTATAFDPEAKEAEDYDTANTHLKFKVTRGAKKYMLPTIVSPGARQGRAGVTVRHLIFVRPFAPSLRRSLAYPRTVLCIVLWIFCLTVL